MQRYTWRIPPLTPAQRDGCESMMERYQYATTDHQQLAIYGALPDDCEPPPIEAEQ